MLASCIKFGFQALWPEEGFCRLRQSRSGALLVGYAVHWNRESIISIGCHLSFSLPRYLALLFARPLRSEIDLRVWPTHRVAPLAMSAPFIACRLRVAVLQDVDQEGRRDCTPCDVLAQPRAQLSCDVPSGRPPEAMIGDYACTGPRAGAFHSNKMAFEVKVWCTGPLMGPKKSGQDP